MRLLFHKMHGAGNDFIVVDARRQPSGWATRPTIAALASRRLGVGSEGVILLQESSRADFRMVFFNPDGGEAEMCGNGARCVALFAHAIGAAPRRMRFETAAGMVGAEVMDQLVRIGVPPITRRRGELSLDVSGRPVTGYALTVGVPHLVVPVADAAETDVNGWGRQLRHDAAFAPAGTNVNFVSRLSGDTWLLRTYERGVEGESGACGTGAVAAATVLREKFDASANLSFRTRDGFVLGVCLAGSPTPQLEGPAQLVFRGEMAIVPGEGSSGP